MQPNFWDRTLGIGIALLAAAALLAASAAGARPTVVVVSLDGVRHDGPDRTRLPALERMAREGARAERVVPVFPSNTFPAHVSMATGTHPDRHGIVDNQFFDRERGAFDRSDIAAWLEAEPLWIAAERQGVPSAVYFWVGSETDWRGARARYRISPFDPDRSEAEKIEQIERWLDLPENERPGLVMTWWHGVDRVAHRKGPDHPDVVKALVEQDRLLGRLLAALDAREAWRSTTLFVVSDHGMIAANETLDAEEVLEAAGIEARVSAVSTVAHVLLEDAADLERAEAALRGLEGIAVHRGSRLPGRLRLRHATRTGDLVLLARPPYTFSRRSRVTRLAQGMGTLAGWERGAHGFDPELPEMGAILFALGRGVPRGEHLGVVRQIDLAATLARLLGIDPPAQSEGRPIPAIGSARAEPSTSPAP